MVDENVVPEPTNEEQGPSVELVAADDALFRVLHILPVTERPFFPGQVMPLLIRADPWMETVERIGEAPGRTAGILLVKGDGTEIPTPTDFNAMGTVVRVREPQEGDGMILLEVEGLARFRVAEWISAVPPLVAQVDYPKVRIEDEEQVKAYGLAIINTLKELVPLNPLYGEQMRVFLNRFKPNDPAPFADFAANLTSAKKEELQDVLDTVPVIERMRKVLVLIRNELEVAKLEAQIRSSVEERMTEEQRKFFLKQQLKEIQKELGISKDDKTAELDRFRARLDGLTVPETAQKRIDEELEKMAILELGSPEYGVTRNYLEWVTALPWGRHSEDKLDLAEARTILNRDHEGLDDVKQRIVEFLAVGARKGEIGGSILLFVGPPGVGKTSIGRSIAEALGREFYRFSLGGMRDEAEIKGHRRTYIGAMPGKFIQAIKETGVSNPVIMLDEIDKVGASFRGDPASALLEVLDPEQNANFLDHYLDLPFDLSKVLFVCTANQLDTIPGPLLDRMEGIHLAGYITREKVAIARNHLWPRQLARAGAKGSEVKLDEKALMRVVEGYAREAGVRNLEKQLGRIVRKAIVMLLEGAKKPVRVGVRNLEDFLGKPRFRQKPPGVGVGVITGLAWTAMGGATLDVEAARVHGKSRGFKLTGQLGSVMKESAEIAYSFVIAHLKTLKGKEGFFDEALIHLHVPEGATPKDGPSAGVTMATALVSLARGTPVARPLAMTGELTLTGRVLPVGGIREKVIAARRVGIGELILPDDNRKDFEELPDYLKEGMTVNFAKVYGDVAGLAFAKGKK
jgi:ATP-dependent Lon protease